MDTKTAATRDTQKLKPSKKDSSTGANTLVFLDFGNMLPEITKTAN